MSVPVTILLLAFAVCFVSFIRIANRPVWYLASFVFGFSLAMFGGQTGRPIFFWPGVAIMAACPMLELAFLVVRRRPS